MAIAGALRSSGAPHARARERRPGRSVLRDDARLGAGVGWFSIGLGTAQLVATPAVAALLGMRDDGDVRRVLRAVGVREVGCGLGVLARPRAAGWYWARAAGDAMDLALLGAASRSRRARPGRVALSAAVVLGVAALDVLAALARRDGRAPAAISTTRTITVNRSPEDVYRYWRDFENLPRFMRHLESVEITGGSRSHWRAKGPAGTTVEWDAEIVRDEPNRLIAWRSLDGDVPNSGSVRFEPRPAGRGTVVRVQMEYRPPAGRVGAQVAKLFGREPGQEAQASLRTFKQLVETGEVATGKSPAARSRPSIFGQ